MKKLKEITKAEVERISLFLAQLERRVSFTETKQVNLEKIPVSKYLKGNLRSKKKLSSNESVKNAKNEPSPTSMRNIPFQRQEFG